MLYRRCLALTGLALGILAPVAGCLTGDQGADPGSGFSSGGTGHYPGYSSTGYAQGTHYGAAGAGSSGSDAGGTAGSPASDGGTQGDASASACGASATGTFSLAWTLEDGTGAAATCDSVGGEDVEIDVVNLGSAATTSATVPCSAMAATTCAMPAGNYSVSMKLRDATGSVLSEIFAPTLILVDRQTAAVASLPFQVGGGDPSQGRGIALTWSIDQVTTQSTRTCGDVGAATVQLTAGSSTFTFSCTDGKGRTTALAPGSVPVMLDLLDSGGAPLSATTSMNVTVGAGQLIFLGNVPFDVN
jgi:hypothetical protein